MKQIPWFGTWLASTLLGALCGASWVAPAAAQVPEPLQPATTRASRGALTWLDWEAPLGCPERAAVYARTREAAGFAPEHGRFERVRGSIVPGAGGFLLSLQFFEGEGLRSRTIEAQNCGDLEGAAAVAIALALGSEAPSSAPAAAPPPEPADAAPARAQPAAAGERGARFSGSALIDLQSVAQASWGLGASARARFDALELGLVGLWIPPSRRDIREGESVRFGLAAVGPVACWRWRVPLTPAACAAFELGKLNADGTGLSQNVRRFEALWLAPSLALELEQALGEGWGVQLRAEVLRPLLRERYTVNGSERVYDSPDAVLRAALGLVWSLD